VSLAAHLLSPLTSARSTCGPPKGMKPVVDGGSPDPRRESLPGFGLSTLGRETFPARVKEPAVHGVFDRAGLASPGVSQGIFMSQSVSLAAHDAFDRGNQGAHDHVA